MRRMQLSVVLVFLVGLTLPVMAEDVEKRFRIGLAGGFHNVTDEQESAAANNLFLILDDLSLDEIYSDPRDDSSVFGNLEVKSGTSTTLYAQYAVNKIFLVEASLGYSKNELGDVEVQAQFDGVDVPDIERFLFATFRVPVGDLELVPLRVTGLARFRPRASFNPFIGGGIGYTFLGFEAGDEFNQLSQNMDSSRGGLAVLTPSLTANPSFIPPQSTDDLEGAAVSAKDYWEFHLAGGAELTFKRKWSLFVDFRWTLASRDVEIGFNGGQELGITVPNLTKFRGTIDETFGAVRVSNGGLLDGGSLQPEAGAPMGTDCDVTPSACEFEIGAFDGEVDTGFYYAQGGKIDLSGFSGQFGVRFTF